YGLEGVVGGNLSESRTAGHVPEEAVVRPTEPSAQRREPIDLLLAGQRQIGRRHHDGRSDEVLIVERVALTGPVDIAFDAQHALSGLPVEACLTTRNRAGR